MTSTGVVAKEIPLEEEYKKSGISPADISKLRAWLNTQPHLPAEHITDLDLILAFHCCDRSLEESKQLLDLHFTLKTLFTSFFKDRVFDDRVKILIAEVILSTPLPTRTPEGYGVFYTRLLDTDATKFNFADACRAGLMHLDLWQYETGTCPGLIFVLDLDGMSLGHLAKLDLQSVQQFFYFVQKGLLVNLKALHFLNAPSFMDRLMMLIRPFLQKSLMVHIHQMDSTTFDKSFPIKELPTGARGGKGRSLEDLRKDALLKMEASKAYFMEENKKRVVEANRPGGPKTISDIFGGSEGSFKKLDID